MKKSPIILFILLLSLCAGNLSGQTLEQAKKFFINKQYDKAKPAFAKLVKSYPSNASYNYWYGACCYETGEKELSEKYLLIGAQKKVQESFRYLSLLYWEQYRFEEAVKNIEEYISALQKSKKPVAEYEAWREKARIGAKMLKGVEEVAIIDSFVVDKKAFLSTYKISEEAGSLFTYQEFFEKDTSTEGIVYQTEMKNKLFYGEKARDGKLNIYTRTSQQDKWGKPVLLPEIINTTANENYPYVLSDGITIYYASDGENSLGGYDIFVTRYNTNTDTYLVPDNIGMPFNSPFNDYMYVIDEYNNLGWFASDRYQSEDKVCIYAFIPNTSKQTYNYETIDNSQLHRIARLESIEDTWANKEDVRAAKQRLAMIKYYKPEKKEKHDFTFIIDDNTTYYKADDFTSPIAKSQHKRWEQKKRDFEKIKEQLDSQRDIYARSNAAKRKSMKAGILDLEKRAEEMEKEISQMEVKVRNEEIKNLAK